MDSLTIVSILTMSVLAIFFASILAVADKKLRVEEDPKIAAILTLLPGVNCGACGCIGCSDFAEKVVKDDTSPAKCRVISDEIRTKIFALTGGGEEETVCRKFALVKCAAKNSDKPRRGEYNGVETCRGANLIFGSGMDCEYGCMGFGDCVKVCPFGTLRMEDGLPVVTAHKCTGCGKCARACPRKIIEVQEKRYEKIFYVACSSFDNMARVREICKVGCIACGICEKLAPEKFFKVENNLSRADYARQENQEKCAFLAGKCPTKVIKTI